MTSDHGVPNDVHPREKRELGRRLALVARAKVYGEKIELSGSQPVQAVARDAEVKIIFSHAAGLETSDAMSVKSFELAGGGALLRRVFAEALFCAGWQNVFSVTREGRPLRMRRYVYSESFAAIANAALAKATGDAHLKRQIMGREVVIAITKGKLDFGPWEQIFYGEFDGNRRKRVLVKIIGD